MRQRFDCEGCEKDARISKQMRRNCEKRFEFFAKIGEFRTISRVFI
jgi:hypothetical protein